MDIKTCVENQRAYFNTHATLSYAFRFEALTLLKRVIQEHELEIMEALKQDLGKSNFESYMTEIGMVFEELNYARKNLKKWMGFQRVPTPLAQFPAVSFTMAEPLGVALIMAPWNYPFQLTMSPLIGALAAGNCAIVKPSAYAPATSHCIAKLLNIIYDECYVAVIEGGRAENTELLEQRFDTIFFTGGVQVGRLVMEKASRWLTPVTLELGGKSPCLVDASADIELAARRIIFGKPRTAAWAMTPWWEWVRLIKSSFFRSHSTTTMPLSRAAAAMWARAESVSPRARKILSMGVPARRASVTALRPSMMPSASAWGAGLRSFMIGSCLSC